MARLFFILISLMLPQLVLAQQSGETLLEYFNSLGGVSVEYSLSGISQDGKIAISDSGTAEIQGNCYHVKSAGIEIFSNGITSYYYSAKSEELVITDNEAIPLLAASDITKKSSGEIVAVYTGPDKIVYTVELKNLTPLENPLPASAFVFSDLDNPSLIITDIR